MVSVSRSIAEMGHHHDALSYPFRFIIYHSPYHSTLHIRIGFLNWFFDVKFSTDMFCMEMT
jgi:hypothetical protein